MKGETCGVLVKSFEGLRARMYTFTIEVDYESKRKTKKVLMNIIIYLYLLMITTRNICFKKGNIGRVLSRMDQET